MKMARSSRKRAAQQPLEREDTDNQDTTENDIPEPTPMEEDATQGSRKKQKVQVMEDSNQTDVERRGLRVKLRDMQRKVKGTEDGVENNATPVKLNCVLTINANGMKSTYFQIGNKT